MSKLGWSIVSGILGLILGVIGGGSLGVLGGAVGGTAAGSVVGVCKAAQAAVDQKLLDAATADKLIASTVTGIERDTGATTGPTRFTSLAACHDANKL